MAAGQGDPDGFGFPGDGDGYEESHDGYGDVQIPDIYQRIVVVRAEQDYVHEADEDAESDPEDDYDLTAPPLES